ncbi:hypothetical protein F4780DRAFT_216246 [Xylariomycetidae sp. FL0641]|nr:hypothetical protein F4780DRAFT_216246 [Xylariomycetidae sp. FL0641]
MLVRPFPYVRMEVNTPPGRDQLWTAVTSSFQTDIEHHVNGIRHHAQEVNRAIGLAKAQSDKHEQELQATERKKASKHRFVLEKCMGISEREAKDASRWRSLLNERDEIERNRGKLEALSSFDHFTAFKQARAKRYHGTGEWIFKTKVFQDRTQENGPDVLWLSGKIGSGKTILRYGYVSECMVRVPHN